MMSEFASARHAQRERQSDQKHSARDRSEGNEEHAFNSFKGGAINRNNEHVNYQKIPGKIRKQHVDASQPGEGRTDSSALNLQIKKGLEQVEPVINS